MENVFLLLDTVHKASWYVVQGVHVRCLLRVPKCKSQLAECVTPIVSDAKTYHAIADRTTPSCLSKRTRRTVPTTTCLGCTCDGHRRCPSTTDVEWIARRWAMCHPFVRLPAFVLLLEVNTRNEACKYISGMIHDGLCGLCVLPP